MRTFFFSLFLLISLSASAANNSVHEACRRLCEVEADCLRRCVSHAELMEVRADLVNVAADFHKNPEIRLTALRTGASLDTFGLCGKTGWSTDNKLICLRSYPTAELIKSCKNLSPREEDQVRCVRNGKSSVEVDACSSLLTSPELRLECIGLPITAQQAFSCKVSGLGSQQRLDCLKRLDRSPASR